MATPIAQITREELLRSTAFATELRVGDGRYVETAIAAAKVVFSVYKALSSLNSKAELKEALAEISEKLTEIISQLGEINRKLDLLFEHLEEIEEKIDQAPWKAAALDNAGARETIAENFEHWSSPSATADDLRDARDAKARIARNTRVLTAGNKMAYIYDVMLSYAFELNLDLLLKTPKSTLVNASSKVIQYLKDALDGTVEGSIQFYLDASLPEYNKLLEQEARLDREDYVGTEYMITKQNKFGYVRCEFRMYDVIRGSLLGNDLERVRDAREIEGSCIAHNYKKGTPLRTSIPDERSVPSHDRIKDMLERFISHQTVVDFARGVIPEIAATITLIEDRVTSQSEVVWPAP